jgi:hypothetical protein
MLLVRLCSQYSAIRPSTYGAIVFHQATSAESPVEPLLKVSART